MATVISRFRYPVVIQTPKTVVDGAIPDAGGVIDLSNPTNWKTFAARRADVIETGGREFVQGRQVQAGLTHLLVFRSDTLLRQWTPMMRIRFLDNGTTRILNIVRVNLDGPQRRQMIFECKETV